MICSGHKNGGRSLAACHGPEILKGVLKDAIVSGNQTHNRQINLSTTHPLESYCFISLIFVTIFSQFGVCHSIF